MRYVVDFGRRGNALRDRSGKTWHHTQRSRSRDRTVYRSNFIIAGLQSTPHRVYDFSRGHEPSPEISSLQAVMTTSDRFRCWLVDKSSTGKFYAGPSEQPATALAVGDVLVRVQWSSLNYKDALAATGHPGITKAFPHVPGIDAAGVVVESTSLDFPIGTDVIATGHELGVERWGGWAELIRVPAAWLVHRPASLSPEDAMTIGTAGFTAAQSVSALQHAGITPGHGPVIVTGATGGVGSLSIQILAQQGYEVVAVSGKRDQREWLFQIGAKSVISREEFLHESERPLLSAKWAAGVDTVGGQFLTTLLRSLHHRGCVAACGVVGGAELPLTVYPFILRGVTLAGIDSAWCPPEPRRLIWQQLAGPWRPKNLATSRTVISLEEVGPSVEQILQGASVGRTVIHIA